MITQIFNIKLNILHCELKTIKTSYNLSVQQNLYSPHK